MGKNNLTFVKYFFMLAFLVSILFGMLADFYGNIDEGAVRYNNRIFKLPCPPFKAYFIYGTESDGLNETIANKQLKEVHYVVAKDYDCDCLYEILISKFVYNYLDTIKCSTEKPFWSSYDVGKLPIGKLYIISSPETFITIDGFARSIGNIDWGRVQKNTIVEIKFLLDKKTNKEKIIEFSSFRCPQPKEQTI